MDFPETDLARAGCPSYGRPGQRSVGAARPRGSTPEIDLSGSLEDTGVSHRHAVLDAPVRRATGPSWTRDSTNGTYPQRRTRSRSSPNHPDPPVRRRQDSCRRLDHRWPWSASTPHPWRVTQTSTAVRRRTPGTWPATVVGAPRSTCSVLSGSACRAEEVPIGAAKKRAVLALLALRVGSPVSVRRPRVRARGAKRSPRPPSKRLQGYDRELRQAASRSDTIETTSPLGPTGSV